MKKLHFIILLSLSTVLSAAPISFTGTDYTQNFNSLASTGTKNPWANDSTIPGWYAYWSEVSAGNWTDPNQAWTEYDAQGPYDGANERLFSWGTDSDRAFGPSRYAEDTHTGLIINNDTDAAITSFTLSGESNGENVFKQVVIRMYWWSMRSTRWGDTMEPLPTLRI